MKKQSPNWYIAATHYLTAGFVPPLLLGFLASFIASISPLFIAGISKVLFGFIFLVLAIWLGTMYSAKYLKKTYVITSESKQRIVNLATFYFIVLRLIFYIYGFLLIMTKIRISGGTIADFLLNIFIFIAVGGVLFYYLSRKYITEDSAITNQ
ncbi:MAG: hypothetical protein HYT36_00995 [Candidatus Staskawiczbacteria bacterium]|nr:hypothetical protein [Candidatus Staskawiczbacteria bacterium]